MRSENEPPCGEENPGEPTPLTNRAQVELDRLRMNDIDDRCPSRTHQLDNQLVFPELPQETALQILNEVGFLG